MKADLTTRDQNTSMRVLENRAEPWKTRTGSAFSDSQVPQQSIQGGHVSPANSYNGNAKLHADRMHHVSRGAPHDRESERILRIMSSQE